jgi:hypothetical protein
VKIPLIFGGHNMNNFDQALVTEIPSGISIERNHATYRAKLLMRAKIYKNSGKFINVKKDILDIISPKPLKS